MGSAMNHKARSHRSYKRRMSAMSGSARRARLYEANKYGRAGAPYASRLAAFRRALFDRRKKKAEEVAAEA